MTERFLHISAVVDRTSLSKPVIYRLVKEGKFPKQVQVSPNRVAWVEGEIDKYMVDLKAQRTKP
ncbi:MAG: AlpA family phage regulatory protein [Alphaproteobacteria bacterium]|nr:AlpA family phage regulatory protein [Alphaproteobacteria bacterium]